MVPHFSTIKLDALPDWPSFFYKLQSDHSRHHANNLNFLSVTITDSFRSFKALRMDVKSYHEVTVTLSQNCMIGSFFLTLFDLCLEKALRFNRLIESFLPSISIDETNFRESDTWAKVFR